MSTLKSSTTICLPAHILDADISPRAREVLMVLASQTTAEHSAVWVCPAAIAERLRCSAVTVKRAIQKLVEAKLIVETGDLHERRHKFYRVQWSLNSVTPAKNKDWMPACAGMTKKETKPGITKPAQVKAKTPIEKPKREPAPKPTEHTPPSHPGVDHNGNA